MTDPFDPNPRRYLSVSQLKQYERCPYSYKLARLDKAWQRPAAWLPQGTAVHAAIEAWERSGRSMSLEAAQDVFREEFRKEVNDYCAITPNFEWWSKSGPYDGKKDIERRHGIGLEQVGKYLTWAEGTALVDAIWITPDGRPAIELGFDMDLDGVLVRGYIDAIVVQYNPDTDREELVVRDHKTGNNPGDDFQLGVYSVAIEDKYGVKPEKGDYWMGRSGKPTYPFDLREWTRESVGAKFRELEENVRAKRFDPDPEPDKCKFCDVSYACEFALG